MSQYMKVETHLLQTPFCFLRNKDESEPENRSLISYNKQKQPESSGLRRFGQISGNMVADISRSGLVIIFEPKEAVHCSPRAQNAYNLQQSCSTTDHLAPRTTSTSPPPQT